MKLLLIICRKRCKRRNRVGVIKNMKKTIKNNGINCKKTEDNESLRDQELSCFRRQLNPRQSSTNHRKKEKERERERK